MSDSYEIPKVWKYEEGNGGKFSSINRPTAGARFDKDLSRGNHPFQLYSLATPNGVKVTIMFEELLGLNHKEAEYDAYLINIQEAEQFSSGFVEINPNSKIPALMDFTDKENPIRIFESGSILLYLAEKFNEFLPRAGKKRVEVLNWLFWQMGSAPYLGGGFGHFYSYAPEKIKYCINRFTMETKRQLNVLDNQLANNEYIAGEEYSIADIAIWPWYGALVKGDLYNASEFIDAASYENVLRWANQIDRREAVKKGRLVNRAWGDEDQQLLERHSSSDFSNLRLDS